MATIFDTFNRSNTTTGLGTASGGFSWTDILNSWVVSSNQARNKTNNTTGRTRAESDLGSTDQYAQVSVTIRKSTSTSDIRICLRYDSASDTCYQCGWSEWQKKYRIYKIVSGAETVLASSGLVDPSVPFTLRFEVEGTALRVYNNSSLVLSTTDSSITTGNRAGLAGFTNGIAHIVVDDFEAGALNEATTQAPTTGEPTTTGPTTPAPTGSPTTPAPTTPAPTTLLDECGPGPFLDPDETVVIGDASANWPVGPGVVRDRSTGRIWAAFAGDGDPAERSRLVWYSDDDGATWSDPETVAVLSDSFPGALDQPIALDASGRPVIPVFNDAGTQIRILRRNGDDVTPAWTEVSTHAASHDLSFTYSIILLLEPVTGHWHMFYVEFHASDDHQDELRHVISTDDLSSWGTPVAVGPKVYNGSVSRFAIPDGLGNIFLSLRTYNYTNPPLVDAYGGYILKWNGSSWSTAHSESSSDSGNALQSAYQIAVSGDGSYLHAIGSWSGGVDSLRVKHLRLSLPGLSLTDLGFMDGWVPGGSHPGVMGVLSISEDGVMHVVGTDDGDPPFLYTRSCNSGVTWSDVEPLSKSGEGDFTSIAVLYEDWVGQPQPYGASFLIKGDPASGPKYGGFLTTFDSEEQPGTPAPTTQATTTPAPATPAPTTTAPVTPAPTTLAPTTAAPTTPVLTTAAPTTPAPTTPAPTTLEPTTLAPTTAAPTTTSPTTPAPTTLAPTTLEPTTLEPTTPAPTTLAPTTPAPTTTSPTTLSPTTTAPTTPVPTTVAPTTPVPTTASPTTAAPTTPVPTTAAPTTPAPTTAAPTTQVPTTAVPTTPAPTTTAPTTLAQTTAAPTTPAPLTPAPTTPAPPTVAPTTQASTTSAPTTPSPTTSPGTTTAPVTSEPTTPAPTTAAPTTIAPTTALPYEVGSMVLSVVQHRGLRSLVARVVSVLSNGDRSGLVLDPSQCTAQLIDENASVSTVTGTEDVFGEDAARFMFRDLELAPSSVYILVVTLRDEDGVVLSKRAFGIATT